ncbi:hypothetical protein L1049_007243 [Liquidambar formosana]|uniref:FAS1 domain-containing protein n=1 Tax=Liquidambar formosana TaxID=63359 RepID=A0AAP0RKC2_LIQFO
MATLLLISLTLLSLLSLSSPVPTQTIQDAAEILSNSGFVSMALTLELVSPQTPIPQSPSATIFSPPDAAFTQSGQPSLSLLQFHFSPVPFSFENLKSLPSGSKIPTMFSGHSLVVTSSASDDQFSLNNVKINGSPIFDDGSLIIFGIDDFFDPEFQVSPSIQSPSPNPNPNPNLGCAKSTNSSSDYSIHEASRMLRSTGYSVIASFLDLQLLGFRDELRLTVFAPGDEVMATYIGNYSDYSTLFLRHVVPCKFSLSDLANFKDGTVLPTYLEGFKLNITRSGDILLLNDVPIIFRDMYSSDWLAVHGLREILTVPERPGHVGESLSENEASTNEEIVPHRVEF